MDIIKCVIRGQRLSVNVPVMADLTVNYFNIMANFDSTWERYPLRYVHIHSAEDSTVGGDWTLDSENKVADTEGINLTAGEWEIWFHGAVVDDVTLETVTRITTERKVIKVLPTGNEGGIMPIIPESNVEQITALAEEAVAIAQGVRDDADSGEFNGATFTPSVSSEGIISWTNDKDLPNPTSQNIKGPKGDTGTGIPTGGTIGQVIVKGSGDDVSWGEKQNVINITGIPKGTGSGNFTTAEVGTDYAIPSQIPIASNSNPSMDGTASSGSGTEWSRSDHVHPHDSLIVRENLLDNWYFVKGSGTTGAYGVFPVNQRGNSSYIGVNGYTIDRWATNAIVNIELNADGINHTIPTMPSGGSSSFYQYLSSNFEALKGKTLTCSMIANYNNTGRQLYTFTFTLPTTIPSALNRYGLSSMANGLYLGFWSRPTGELQIAVVSSITVSSLIIEAMKVEIGDTQTLAHQEGTAWVLNEIPDYGEQLRRCQQEVVDISSLVQTGKNLGTTSNSCVISNGCAVISLRTYNQSTATQINTTEYVFTLPVAARPKTTITIPAICASTNFNNNEFSYVTIYTSGGVSIASSKPYYQVWVAGSYPV